MPTNRKKIFSYYLSFLLGLFYVCIGLLSIYYSMKDTIDLVEGAGSSTKKKLELVDNGQDRLS